MLVQVHWRLGQSGSLSRSLILRFAVSRAHSTATRKVVWPFETPAALSEGPAVDPSTGPSALETLSRTRERIQSKENGLRDGQSLCFQCCSRLPRVWSSRSTRERMSRSKQPVPPKREWRLTCSTRARLEPSAPVLCSAGSLLRGHRHPPISMAADWGCFVSPRRLQDTRI